ncbi:MAG: DnaJ C-terminal domain-containing protein [Anaerolineales bacterium]|nr:DnaJ C-terminal domain-containing protein [Anaerolineales bacterium]
MDFKDYYEILGVPPNAEKKVIQQTFRQLARKHHPDVNPGNKEAEEKFKTINEAYQVLSDVKQRKKYDELRAQYQQWQKTGGQQQQDFDWQNWSAESGKGARTQYANAEDLEDLFGSASPYSNFFTNIFGQARRSGSGQSTSSRPRRGRDVEYEVDLTLEEAFRGTERALEIDGHRIQASIPLGVRTGTRVRLTGRGESGRNGGAAGDLYLIIKVLSNDIFERDGDDLHMDAAVDIFTAIAGGEIRIPAPERPLTLTIPPRTNANQTFRLRGKGMPYLREPNKRGDMFAHVKLVLPDALTNQEVEGITALASARQKHTDPGEVKL